MRKVVYQWDLLWDLVKRDIKIHYRRSALGLLWSQVNPLFTLIVFSFVFQKLVPLNIANYPAYVFVGLLTWSWFSSSITQSSFTLIQSRDLVRKPQFPTEMIIVVSVMANFINLVLAGPILLGLLLINGLIPNWTLVFLPLVLVSQFFFTLGLALIFSAANVFFRDVQHIVTLLVTLWFYITPVFYSVTTGNEYQLAVQLNPMAQLIKAYRQILLLGQPPELRNLLGVLVLGLLIFSVGLLFFRRVKYNFVDEL
jgi:lipopolysaccharide transport system permease protein